MDESTQQLVQELQHLKRWAFNYGDIEEWKKHHDWNQDKTNAYGYGLMAIYGRLNKILDEKSTIPYDKQNSEREVDYTRWF